VRELITMVGMNDHDEKSWMIPVLKTEAIRDVGVSEVIEALEKHHAHLAQSGGLKSKALAFLKDEVGDILAERLTQSVNASFATSSGEEVLQNLLLRKIDPYTAADLISRN
jgi:LAO/AO transport system kinase